MAYTKLFSTIVTSSIWTADDKTRIVWITMLAIADRNGEVQASIPGLARVAGVSIPDAERAVEHFLSPDPYSRTPDDEGRRLEKIDGGWALLNHAKYRNLASKDEQRTANAERQKRYRDKARRSATVTDGNGMVTDSNAKVTDERDIADADADADAEAKRSPEIVSDPKVLPRARCAASNARGTIEELKAFAVAIGQPESDGEACFYGWEANGWTLRGKPMKSWQAAMRNWKARGFLASQKGQSASQPRTVASYECDHGKGF